MNVEVLTFFFYKPCTQARTNAPSFIFSFYIYLHPNPPDDILRVLHPHVTAKGKLNTLLLSLRCDIDPSVLYMITAVCACKTHVSISQILIHPSTRSRYPSTSRMQRDRDKSPRPPDPIHTHALVPYLVAPKAWAGERYTSGVRVQKPLLSTDKLCDPMMVSPDYPRSGFRQVNPPYIY